jgi:hypothetical protein
MVSSVRNLYGDALPTSEPAESEPDIASSHRMGMFVHSSSAVLKASAAACDVIHITVTAYAAQRKWSRWASLGLDTVQKMI